VGKAFHAPSRTVPQRDSSDEHARHTDDSPGSLEVGTDSAGEARRVIIKWQDLCRVERGFELRYSVLRATRRSPETISATDTAEVVKQSCCAK